MNKDTSAIALDYFAGSGTTAHALLNLNKKDKTHKIETNFGIYTFIFSDETIFGRLDDVELIKDINNLNLLSNKVNVFSGKLNFHFDDVFIFIESIQKVIKG